MFARCLATTLVSTVVLFSSVDREEQARRLDRLREMPVEHRRALADRLDRFDRLDSETQERLRRIDDEIARFDPAVIARYRSTLHRYHLWVQSLKPEQAEALSKAASAGARIALVNEYKTEQAKTRANDPARNFIPGLKPTDLAMPPMILIGHQLRVWFKLGIEERRRVEAIAPPQKQARELNKLARDLGEPPPPPIVNRLADERAESALRKLFETEAPAKPAAKRPVLPARLKLESQLGLLISEALHFSEKKSAKVSPENLARFEKELPRYVRAWLDWLPAQEARQRLAILYREVFPEPAEIKPLAIEEDAKAKKSADPARSNVPTIEF